MTAIALVYTENYCQILMLTDQIKYVQKPEYSTTSIIDKVYDCKQVLHFE